MFEGIKKYFIKNTVNLFSKQMHLFFLYFEFSSLPYVHFENTFDNFNFWIQILYVK